MACDNIFNKFCKAYRINILYNLQLELCGRFLLRPQSDSQMSSPALQKLSGGELYPKLDLFAGNWKIHVATNI